MGPNGVKYQRPTRDLIRDNNISLQNLLQNAPSANMGVSSADKPRPEFDANAEGWLEITDGAFVGNDRFDGLDVLKDMPKTPPKEYEISLDTVGHARDALFEVCKNFKEKFIDRAGLEQKLANCENALKKITDDGKRKKLEGQFRALKDLATKIIREREEITRFIPVEKRPVKNLNASTKYIETIARRDLHDAYTALRDLDYDLKRAHGRFGKFSQFKNYLSQTFTPSRNALIRAAQRNHSALQSKFSALKDQIKAKFTHKSVAGLDELQLLALDKGRGQKVSSLTIQNADAHYDEFVNKLNAFAESVGDPSCRAEQMEIGDTHVSMGVRKADEALKDIETFKEVLYTQSGGQKDYSYDIEESLTAKFKSMTKGESGQEFVLSVEGGVVVPVPVVSLKAGVKYECSFKVFCNDANQVKIERCHAGGVKSEISLDAEIVSFNAEADAKVGGGTREDFMSPEDAARMLARGKKGAINSFFVNGKGEIKKALKSLVTNGDIGKMKYDEGRFIVQAQKRGLLHKTNSVSFKNMNSAYLADSTFIRLGGGIGDSARLNAVVKANAALSASIESDINAHRTQHRSYYAYFSSDRIGEAKDVYLKLADETGTIDNPAKLRELLARAPQTDAERKTLAQDILEELKAMSAREVEFSRELLARDEKDLPTAEAVCAQCRLSTLALVALEDKLASLGLPADKKFDDAFTSVRDELRDNLLRPRGMLMKKEELLAGLYVDRSYKVNSVTTKLHLSASYDLSTNAITHLKGLKESPFLQAGGDALKTTLEKAGSKSAMDVDIICEKPLGDDLRPFRKQPRIRLDFSFKGDLTGKAIVALINNAIQRAANKTEIPLSEQGLDAKSILKMLFKDSIKTGLLSLKNNLNIRSQFSDQTDQTNETDETIETIETIETNEEAEEKLLTLIKSHYTSDGSGDSKMLVSFIMEDGRISAAGLGSKGTTWETHGFNIGPGHIGMGLSTGSRIMGNTTYATPSFDSLVAKCDDFRVMGHHASWKQFSMKHKSAFLRMAAIVGGKTPAGDTFAADDAKRLQKTLSAILKDIQNCPRQEQRDRLAANYNRLATTIDELRGHFAKAKADRTLSENEVLEKLRGVLESVASHYNILESVGGYGGALAEDMVKDITSQSITLGKGSDASEWIEYG